MQQYIKQTSNLFKNNFQSILGNTQFRDRDRGLGNRTAGTGHFKFQPSWVTRDNYSLRLLSHEIQNAIWYLHVNFQFNL